MSGLGPEYQGMMRDLRNSYREDLPGKARGVQEAAESLLACWDDERQEALYCLAHRLAGSSAIYGFEEVSVAARALEAFMAAAREGSGAAPEERDAQLRNLVQGVADASRRR